MQDQGKVPARAVGRIFQAGWVFLLCWVAQASGGQWKPGEILVKPMIRPGANAGGAGGRAGLAALAAGTGGNGVVRRRVLAETGWELWELPPGANERQWVDRLRRDPAIAFAELNYRYFKAAEPAPVPNDPLYPQMTGLGLIGAPQAWGVTTGDTNVVVAVFDTGVDYRHPDLAPNMWVQPREIPGNGKDDDGDGFVDNLHGADFLDHDGDPMDFDGHGTHVAGTIAAAGSNGIGVTGVAWKVRILAVRILSSDGGAGTADIVEAFEYVRRLRQKDGVNIRVINNSWGGRFPSQAMAEAVARASDAGMLVVCAAGNEHQNTDFLPKYPAGLDSAGILSVAASDGCDFRAGFSNYGRETVHLAAPGSRILSTYAGGALYGDLSGTSMATPHVSGAAALLWSVKPDWTVRQVRDALLETVDRDAGWGGMTLAGGRLNVGRAVTSVAGGSNWVSEIPLARGGTNRFALASRLVRERAGGDENPSVSLNQDGSAAVFAIRVTEVAGGKTNTSDQVYLYDATRDAVTRVSVGLDGNGGQGDSNTPGMSADGRWVVFASSAANLVADDANGATDIFIWERATGRIEAVSVNGAGRTGRGVSDLPSVSADGRFVAFASDATDLITNDRNGVRDVFVRDRQSGVTQLASRNDQGVAGNGRSDWPSISADGGAVAFHSGADNLVAGDFNGEFDVFVRDLGLGRTVRVSVADDGAEAEFGGAFPMLSGDGRWVAYQSVSGEIVDPVNDGFLHVYLHDRGTGRVVRASQTLEGIPFGTDSFLEGLTADGRGVLMLTDALEAPPFFGISAYRPVLMDRLTGVRETLAYNKAGYPANDNSFRAGISGDGRRAGYVTWAFNLATGDGNGAMDVVLEDRGEHRASLGLRRAGETEWSFLSESGPHIPQRMEVRYTGTPASEFQVQLANAGAAAEVFRVRVRAPGGWRAEVTAGAGGGVVTGEATGAGWAAPSLNPGASLELGVQVERLAGAVESMGEFVIAAEILGGGEGGDEVVVVMRGPVASGVPEPVSVGPNGRLANLSAEFASASEDGRWVVFSTEADNLDDTDDNFSSDVYLVDRASGGLRLVSANQRGERGDAESSIPAISRDGRWIVHESAASNLVTGDSNDVQDIFLFDRTTGRSRRVSVSTGGVQANGGSSVASVSQDGRWIVYESTASNLVSGDNNGWVDIFLHDSSTGLTERVSQSPTGESANAGSESPVMSFDGRWIVYTSYASNLGSEDTNGFSDVYLYDRERRSTELISANAAGRAGDGPSSRASLSDDGRWVVFETKSLDILGGGGGARGETVVLDRSTGRKSRIAGELAGIPPEWLVRRAAVTPGGDGFLLVLGLRCGVGVRPGTPFAQVCLFDRRTKQIRVISADARGALGDEDSFGASVTRGGGHVAFQSWARVLSGESRAQEGAQIFSVALPGVAADADGDGMPDEWETANFGGVGVANGTSDWDGDGWLDVDEYRAGTDPKETASRFELGVEKHDGAGLVVLKWNGVAGRQYQLEESPGALEDFVAVGLPLRGVGGELRVERPLVRGMRWFRLRLTGP